MQCEILGKRESSTTARCNGFHIDFWRNNWPTITGNAASSFATNSGRGRRIWQRLGSARLFAMHSDEVKW